VNEQFEEQAALYVLGLLEGEEAAAFEQRLHSETELRGLVDQLDAAAAAVAHSAPPRDLPPELRDRVLAQVRSGKTVAFPRRPNWIPWAIAACCKSRTRSCARCQKWNRSSALSGGGRHPPTTPRWGW
jgi:anti-sigma-K factor RskA